MGECARLLRSGRVRMRLVVRMGFLQQRSKFLAVLRTQHHKKQTSEDGSMAPTASSASVHGCCSALLRSAALRLCPSVFPLTLSNAAADMNRNRSNSTDTHSRRSI